MATSEELDIRKSLGTFKALIHGLPVKIDNVTYRMTKDYDIGLVAERISFDDCGNEVGTSEVLLPADITIQSFIHMCMGMKDEDWVSIVFALSRVGIR